MRELGMVAEKSFSAYQGEHKQAFALNNELKESFTLSEPIGAMLVIPLKVEINSFPNLTGCKLPMLLLVSDVMMT